MPGRVFFLAGSIFGFLGVAAGSFGAHALKLRLSPEMLAVFETAARYQLLHAVVLLFVALAISQNPVPLPKVQPQKFCDYTCWKRYHSALRTSGFLFIAGILIFSGSLYILSLSGVRAWGAVTPLGGLMLLGGWFSLILAAIKK